MAELGLAQPQLVIEYNQLPDDSPPQFQLVWNNVNVHPKHRYQRSDDQAYDNRIDWMASLWIEDRVTANHMEHHDGMPLKDIQDLTISDFVPNEQEKDYVFQSLICYFSHCLVKRHSLLFDSMNHSIKPNKPHQFQQQMDQKSNEFTGKLFTKSECKMEDMISMMEEIQLDVNKPRESDEYCYERKVIR